MTRAAHLLCAAVCAAALPACRDLSSFSTGSGSYAGQVVGANFVLAGVDPSTSLCLTLDTGHLQDTPGSVSTSDGRFSGAPLRTIPQIWQDPLSTLTFGEGRVKNLVYVVSATTPFADGNGNDVFFVLSLMQSGDVEVRMMRGAPGVAVDGGTAPSTGGNLFAVFDLSKSSSPCSY
ncbi:MAG TPA: hypothetical protein VIY73_12095 [Polyangiaceae bacterium]